MCGEKISMEILVLYISGSPPHVRGKAPRSGRCRQGWWDHPRMCGEKTWTERATKQSTGSPPHVRGKVKGVSSSRRPRRITPACAGKSCRRFRLLVQYQDHPRMCGEKLALALLLLSSTGSPPHVRGKVCLFLEPAVDVGITPACAGKSTLERAIAHNARDHPRMCGEKFHILQALLCAPGSPPHVRGKGPAMSPGHITCGITPACAGKSSPHRVSGGGCRDHPRMCGEKLSIWARGSVRIGSPPHVRGKD